ncbi:MAG TPA: FkbM family methyltransferase [Lachnospiraceae bacterium]|nr:FkbM family methyltransferase [Lachnospiraceae bacterium]
MGACEGEDSIRYGLLFKNSIIYSFEPLPDNFNKCVANFARFTNDNIKPFQFALSCRNGNAKFYLSSGNPNGKNSFDWDYGNKSSSLYPPDSTYKKYDWLKFEQTIDIPTKTIESFCAEQSIPEIDFIHMDVQGAELDVLKGAGNHINMIKSIWLEVENVSMYKGQPLKKDIERFMRQSNFFKIIDTAIGDSGDQLYLNSIYFSKISPFVLRTKIISRLKIIYSKFVPFKRRILKLFSM